MTRAVPRHAWFVFALLALAACTHGTQMAETAPPPTRPDRATIVFMRPSALAFLVTAPVYEADQPDPRFVAFVNPGAKVAHEVPPGEHTFMVVGETTDFLRTSVEAGRTYYVLVAPRVGVWQARFSFRPVRHGEFAGEEFAGWDSATPKFYRATPASETRADSESAGVAADRAEAWPAWNARPEEERLARTLQSWDSR